MSLKFSTMCDTSSCARIRRDFILVIFLILYSVSFVDVHRLPIKKRTRLPSLIISASDLRYIPERSYGSTAAEFVVTAGLDRNKPTAIRIKRLEDNNIKRFSRYTSRKTRIFRSPKNVSFLNSNVNFKSKDRFQDRIGDKDLSLLHKAPENDLTSINQRKKRDVLEDDRFLIDDGNHSEKAYSDSGNKFKHSEVLMGLVRNLTMSFLEKTSADGDDVSPRTDGITSRAFRPSSNFSPSLQQLLLSHLLKNVLNPKNNTPIDNGNRTTGRNYPAGFVDRSEPMTPAEQRKYGIIVSPHPLSNVRSPVPVIRVLKGKLISLPQLPPELIPILLGTYNPTYTNPDEHKLTENIIDSAIYTLLQNEELLNVENMHSQNNRVRLGNISNRKSPSSNYVGSLKTNEPLAKPAFRPLDFQADWISGPRCDRLTEEICLDDSDYPSSAIMSSIYKDKAKFDLMYAEIKERKSQVEGLNRKQELAYDYNHYFGQASQTSETVRPLEYGPRGGFVCPSEVHYAKPHRAKNRKGEWKVVVNVGEYSQTLRMEKCLAAGSQCKYVVSHMRSKCSQVFSYHRLLVFNKDQGLHIDIFRVPSGCTCHIRGKNNFYSQPHMSVRDYTELGHIESAPSSSSASESSTNDKRKKASFSDTLWAILGGGRQAGVLAQSPQFLDEVRKQISWTQQLQQFPQFYKQVSPEQVLKQLLDEDEEQRMNTGKPTILQIQRYNNDHESSGGYATHHVPVTVPLREPNPVVPSRKIPRIPITRPKPIFALSPKEKSTINLQIDGLKKFELHPISSISSEDLKEPDFMRSDIFPEVTTHSEYDEDTHTETSPPTTSKQSIDAQEFSDSTSTTTVSSDESFSSTETSTKSVLDSYDRIFYENLFDFAKPDKLHDSSNKNDTDSKEEQTSAGQKINFSYHPILEYLSL